MDAVAIAARPRLWLAGALLGITLLGGHEPCRAPTPVRAPAAVIIQIDPSSDFARLEDETNDHLNTGVGPLASWISHLLQKLAGDAC